MNRDGIAARGRLSLAQDLTPLPKFLAAGSPLSPAALCRVFPQGLPKLRMGCIALGICTLGSSGLCPGDMGQKGDAGWVYVICFALGGIKNKLNQILLVFLLSKTR